MNKFIGALLTLLVVGTGLEACVIYNPSTGTYTVDKAGSVNNGRKSVKPSSKPAKQQPRKGSK